jgi:acyl dehydratase
MIDPATSPLALDFDELEPGMSFVTPGRTVTESDVVAIAGVTGDFHPHHVDAEWARTSQFGERIAHGMLVLSVAAGLVPTDPDRVLALRRVSDAVLKRPVRLGDTIHVEGSLESAREVSEEAGLAVWRWRVLNQRAEMVARVAVEVLWRRGPAAPPAGDTVESDSALEAKFVLPL